ncbi:hypothetical protein [Candidatus Frankia alpina]|uniref:hypothetical protein n=1 Tax=Candidatus Frankia alpina TaxID=2699483 RepID=UPI001F36E0CD|nr:hypothetical protein [Candidatus Frankia alpina]
MAATTTRTLPAVRGADPVRRRRRHRHRLLHSSSSIGRPCPATSTTCPTSWLSSNSTSRPAWRLPARIVGVDPAQVRCGLRVRAEFADLPGGDFTVAVFRPVDGL